MSTDVEVKWSPALRVSEGTQNDPPGGIYLWFLPDSEAVVYVGETADFRARLIQHVACAIGYGGTVFDFDLNDEPYEWLSSERLRSADTDGRVIFPWNMTNDSTAAFLVAIDHDEAVVDRVRLVVRFLRAVRILYGGIEDTRVDRREIEGGIIDGFRKYRGIGHYGRNSNDTIIGKISKYPCRSYRLKASAGSDPDGAEWAEILLRDALPSNEILP